MPEPRVLVSDIGIGESPRWHDGRLWFADWSAGNVVAVDVDGTCEVITGGRTMPFCIEFLADGTPLIVSGIDGGLMRLEPDGSVAVHANLCHLSEGRWNDIVVDGRGNIYVNDVGFDLMNGGEVTTGIVALVKPDGSAIQVADDMHFPNGMTVTADNSTLIVAESYARRLTAFDIATDGGLSDGRVWADLGDGVPDGICIDVEGAVWYADVPNKRCVRVREGGEVLDTVQLDRGCFACMLGGHDGRTLFIVSANWNGPAAMFADATPGQLVSYDAAASHAGWP